MSLAASGDRWRRDSPPAPESPPAASYDPSMGREGVTINDVRQLASQLERSYEVLVRDRVKFRVGQIVYLAFSRDDSLMGFAFPKEEREALVAAEPHKFLLPEAGDMRYNWVVVRLAEIDHVEMTELVVEAWRMVVPKKVFNAYLAKENLS
jgi:hypothetical protein